MPDEQPQISIPPDPSEPAPSEPAAPEPTQPEAPPPGEPTPESAPSQPGEEPPAQPAARKWAGQYESPEEMERELFRLQGERDALRRPASQPTAPVSESPNAKISDAELRTLKEQYTLQAADPNTEYQDRAKAARQIRLIDEEMQTRMVAQSQRAAKAEAAQLRLVREAQDTLRQYEPDLHPGNPLHDKAADILQSLVDQGYPDNPITKGMAVFAAAQLTGTVRNKGVQEGRRELLKTVNKAIRTSVASGTGASAPVAPTAPIDWRKVSDEEYDREYRRVMGLD